MTDVTFVVLPWFQRLMWWNVKSAGVCVCVCLLAVCGLCLRMQAELCVTFALCCPNKNLPQCFHGACWFFFFLTEKVCCLETFMAISRVQRLNVSEEVYHIWVACDMEKPIHVKGNAQANCKTQTIVLARKPSPVLDLLTMAFKAGSMKSDCNFNFC